MSHGSDGEMRFHVRHYLDLADPGLHWHAHAFDFINKRFACEVSSRLSQYAGHEVYVQPKSVIRQLLGRILYASDPPIYIQVFRFDPVKAECLLTVGGEVLYSILESGMGGVFKERPYRNFSPLEMGMLDDLSSICLKQMEKACREYSPDIHLVPVRHENSANFAVIKPLDEMVCLLSFNIESNNVKDVLSWILPLEVIRFLNYAMRDPAQGSCLRPFREQLAGCLGQVPGTLGVIGGRMWGSLCDIRRIREGTVLPLAVDPFSGMVAIEVSGRIKFHGRMERTGNRLILTIVDRATEYPWPIYPIGSETILDKTEETQDAKVQHRSDFLDDIPVELSVRIGAVTLAMGEIANLEQGAVIDLQKDAEAPLEVLVNGKQIGFGELVVEHGRVGVRLVYVCSANASAASV